MASRMTAAIKDAWKVFFMVLTSLLEMDKLIDGLFSRKGAKNAKGEKKLFSLRPLRLCVK
jgi:hypothetical protein